MGGDLTLFANNVSKDLQNLTLKPSANPLEQLKINNFQSKHNDSVSTR